MPDVEFLVVGAGAAGWGCAQALRHLGARGSVLLVGRELDAPYDRTLCSKSYLAGTVSELDALLAPPEAWADQGIELLTATTVMSLDPAARTAQLSDRRTLSFGSACLATGANVRRLQIDGAGLDGIHYLRTLRNAARIRKDLEDAERIVLIGGSYIATEAAATLTAAGRRCAIVMQESVTLERTAGRRAGAFIQQLMNSQGIEIYPEDEVVRFEGVGDRVARVETARGRQLAADAVVIGAGVTPDGSLAARAGLEFGVTGGIRVDQCLRTSAEGIFAAGDVCEYPSPACPSEPLRVEHWDAAIEQGRTAARGMVGEPTSHEVVPYFFSDLADWVSLEYVGVGGGWDDEVLRGSFDAGAFTVFQLRAGRLVGALTVGRSQDLDPARELVLGGEDLSTRRTELGDLDAELAAVPKASHRLSVVVHEMPAGAAEPLPPAQPVALGADPAGSPQAWICENCGFIFELSEGDPAGGVPPGTPFEAIPNDWVCPVCGAAKSQFGPL
jgi:3-phenylpropionate/trans-cinnamate dioxygenase ferredoxin reductase subunit